MKVQSISIDQATGKANRHTNAPIPRNSDGTIQIGANLASPAGERKNTKFAENLIKDLMLAKLLEKDATTNETLIERSINRTAQSKPEKILDLATRLLPKEQEDAQQKFAPVLININNSTPNTTSTTDIIEAEVISNESTIS